MARAVWFSWGLLLSSLLSQLAKVIIGLLYLKVWLLGQKGIDKFYSLWYDGTVVVTADRGERGC